MDDKTSEMTKDGQSRELTKTVIKEEHEISVLIAIFSAVSVTVGAGMVAVPKASFESGIPWAIGYNVFNFSACVYSIHLYYECARVTGLYSIPQLGYEWFGHCSLYFVNVITFIGFGILPIAYYIIFAGLLSSLLREIGYVKNHDGFFLGTQWFSVLILAVMIFPLVIKKKIQELKIAGVLLFSGVILFILLMLVLKIASDESLDFHAGDSQKFYKFEFNKEFLSSLSTAFVAYGFQSAFFPIYNSLKVKTYRNAMSFTILGIGFCFVIYISIMFISLYSFGLKIKGDVLKNVEEHTEWESYVLRAIFLLVISTHTPFIFFIGKEAVLSFAALIYTRNNRPTLDALRFQDIIDSQALMGKSKHRSMRVNNTLRHLDDSKRGITSSVDLNISMAIPFYRKSMIATIVPTDQNGEEPKAAHDLLPNSWYYTITLSLYIMVVVLAWFIKDVEIVIKFVGSLANAMLNFAFPGAYYFIIMRKRDELQGQKWKIYPALCLAIYGFSMGVLCTGINIWTTISPLDEPDTD